MDEAFKLQSPLALNAWTGDASPRAAVSAQHAAAWALGRQSGGMGPGDAKMAPAEANAWDWQHPNVGWGLVLPDNPALSRKERSGASDAPAPLQRLLAARPGSPVLRYNVDDKDAHLRRYDAAGGLRKLAMVGSTPGLAELPRYLLIAASPEAIPWRFQYAANLGHYVGRLDLQGDALENYVGALLGNWAGAACDPRAPLVWSVDHGQPDITWLMDQAISRKVFQAFAADPDNDLSRRVGLFDADATAAGLVDALAEHHPALILSTSHGMTGPLDDAGRMAAQLGLPVDRARQLLDVDALLKHWAPDGAIWYSQACCAAGSDARSDYAGLFDAGSDVALVLNGVSAACGARSAPLPQRLLGAPKPLRAFIGHVEPTFDWTLRHPRTGQPLTSSLRRALYEGLYAAGGGRPVAWALERVFDDAGAMLAQWAQAIRGFNKGTADSLDLALYYQVTALDRQHTVILGDPTVSLPSLAGSP